MDKCELITGMIDAINKRGWCQGKLEDDEGHVCIRGAMNVVLTNHPLKFDLFNTRGIRDETEKAIEEFIPSDFLYSPGTLRDPVVRFNNAPETTKEDVLDVLQKTKEKVC